MTIVTSIARGPIIIVDRARIEKDTSSMRSSRPAVRLAVTFGAFALALGPPAGAAAGRPSTVAPAPVQAAQAWLLGLGARSAARLEKVSAFPLAIASTETRRRCGREVPNVQALPATLKCLREREPPLFRGLNRPGGASPLEIIPPSAVDSPDLRALVGKLRPGDTLVRGYVDGDGVSYEIVLRLEARGQAPVVRGFFFSPEGAA
jgi:hypothetical protein